MKALGGKKVVEEWDRATKGMDLPERAGNPKKKNDRQKIAEAMAEAERRRAQRGTEKKAR